MIHADSSIWSTRLVRSRARDERFADLVAQREIVCHPWVLGELLLAGISAQIARDIRTLDFLPVASDEQVYDFIRHYHPRGVGWVDVSLLMSCLDTGAQLWTEDKRLDANAEAHGRRFTATRP